MAIPYRHNEKINSYAFITNEEVMSLISSQGANSMPQICSSFDDHFYTLILHVKQSGVTRRSATEKVTGRRARTRRTSSHSSITRILEVTSYYSLPKTHIASLLSLFR